MDLEGIIRYRIAVGTCVIIYIRRIVGWSCDGAELDFLCVPCRT